MKMRKKYNFNANVRTCSKTYRAICIASKYGNIQFIILFNCKIQEDLLYFNDTGFFFLEKALKYVSILRGTALLPCGSLPVF